MAIEWTQEALDEFNSAYFEIPNIYLDARARLGLDAAVHAQIRTSRPDMIGYHAGRAEAFEEAAKLAENAAWGEAGAEIAYAIRALAKEPTK